MSPATELPPTTATSGKREVWAALPGHPGYWVSDRGRVKSVTTPRRRQRGRMLKRNPSGNGGHLGVTLSNGGATRQVYVHRLVAERFLDNPDSLPVVRHLNDVPTDNRVENLAWGTQADNMADAKANGATFRKAA